MRRHDIDPLGNLKARCTGIDHNRTQPACAGSFTGAEESDVKVCNTAIGNVGFCAIDPVVIAAIFRSRSGGGNIRSAFQFGQCKGGNQLSACHTGQIFCLLRFAAKIADRAATQALHGKDEVREAAMACQSLTDQAERPDIQIFVHTAMAGGHAIAQPAALPQQADDLAAGRVHIVMIKREGGYMFGGPGVEITGERSVMILQKRPIEKAGIGHVNSLRRPAFAWQRTRCKHVRNRASACRWPAPAPRIRWLYPDSCPIRC